MKGRKGGGDELTKGINSMQDTSAQNMISFLNVKRLSLIHTSHAQAQTHVAEATQERASLSAFVAEKHFKSVGRSEECSRICEPCLRWEL